MTFHDHDVEQEFFCGLDEQNIRAATVFLSIGVVLSLAFTLVASGAWLLQDPEEFSLRIFLHCSNAAQVVSCLVPLGILRLRWCSCENAILVASLVLSGLVFTNSTYFMARAFRIEGDHTQVFYEAEPMMLLTLPLLSSAVHSAIHLRSSRSGILPISQVLVYGIMHLCLAPWPWIETVFICMMLAAAGYFSWRGRRRDEYQARVDYLENRELRLAMELQHAESKIQKQTLREIEDRLRAMDACADGCVNPSAAMPPPVSSIEVALKPCEQDVTVPRPSRCRDSALGYHVASSNTEADGAAPNTLLQIAMAGRLADAARIRRMAERISLQDYSIKEFFEDAIVAFPELELFFVTSAEPSMQAGTPLPLAGLPSESVQRSAGELEYQRTMCALFSVYWLLRLDGDGKQGFCFGMTSDWEAQGPLAEPLTSTGAVMKIPRRAQREKFLQSADWSAMREIIASSMGGLGESLDVGRVEALLCLTAFHDVLKMKWLCPRVVEAHGPYKGYAAGAVIHDHDIALAYVMEFYPELLPSYSILPPHMQELVLFTQSKMQFNHGWFVQAEAPPGIMLRPLKSCLATAQPGHLPFYFFHWLTDLSGAEGTPKRGAEKFVLKFPEPVLAAFLWSIPYLDNLAAKTETQVVQEYLAARWQSAFPSKALPTGPDSVALLRLSVMAQGEAEAVVEAFSTLPSCAQSILSAELAHTGSEDQHFEGCPACGGPALLIYYGPALLQRCRGVDEMGMGLQILAATFAASRALWPLSAESQGSTVLVDVGQLRTHDVRSIMGHSTEPLGSLWVLSPENEREASLRLMPAGQVNQLNQRGLRYWVLDLHPNVLEVTFGTGMVSSFRC